MNLFRAGRLSYSNRPLTRGAGHPWKPIDSLAITICVFSIGLLFWFTVVFGFVPLNLAEAREFWLGRAAGGLTLFEAFVVTTVLLGWWVFFRILSVWLLPGTFSLPSMVLYVANLTVIGVVGYNLHNMRTTVLNDQLYARMQESDLTKRGRYLLGRIRNWSPDACGRSPEPCVLVELENGELVLAHDPGTVEQLSTEIVFVDSILGRQTGVLRYYELSYYIEGDVELRWAGISNGRE